MKLLVLVNSGRDSTDGRTARGLVEHLPSVSGSRILYRDDFGRICSIAAFIREARRFRPDVVYVELFGYSGLVAALLIKLFGGVRIGVGNGDHAFGTHWKAGNYGRAFVSGVLDVTLRRVADFWAVWSPFYARWLRKRGVRNVACVPGAVDLLAFQRDPDSNLRKELGFGNELVVGVAGSLVYCEALEMVYGWDLAEALALIPDLPVCGVVIGSGPGLDILKEKARVLGLGDRLRFVGKVSHDDVPRWLSTLDVGLVTLSNDLDARFTWTAKLPEYMACGVFPITTDVGDRSRRFITRCGALLPFSGGKDPLYPRRLAELLRALVRSPELLRKRDRGRLLATALMSYEVAGRHLDRALRRLDEGARRPQQRRAAEGAISH
jgi:glycosyltransferase involved in cell wall biosynthesis